MPYGELFDCSLLKQSTLLNHWKHPLICLTKVKLDRALSGFHTAHCCELPSNQRNVSLFTIFHFEIKTPLSHDTTHYVK